MAARCDRCRGHGGWSRTNRAGTCPRCDGTGVEPAKPALPDIRPCPGCGEPPSWEHDGYQHILSCPDCYDGAPDAGLVGRCSGWGWDKTDAVIDWNWQAEDAEEAVALREAGVIELRGSQ